MTGPFHRRNQLQVRIVFNALYEALAHLARGPMNRDSYYGIFRHMGTIIGRQQGGNRGED